MAKDEPDVLELLIRHELVIKRLYDIFAGMFADRRDFWESLAGDEQKHADWLGTLRSDSTIDKWLSQRGRIKPQALKSSIGYVENQIMRAQKGSLSVLQALSIAQDLESALLEKQFFELSGSVSKEITSVLTDVATETERHRKTIVEAIDIEKR